LLPSEKVLIRIQIPTHGCCLGRCASSGNTLLPFQGANSSYKIFVHKNIRLLPGAPSSFSSLGMLPSDKAITRIQVQSSTASSGSTLMLVTPSSGGPYYRLIFFTFIFLAYSEMFVIVLCMITTSDTSQNSRGKKNALMLNFMMVLEGSILRLL
jgi:hypothetical protein